MSQRHFILNVAKAHFGFFSSTLVPPLGFPDSVNGSDIDIISHDENTGAIMDSSLSFTTGL